MDDKKTILFVCTGNSCRSVIAEGLLKKKLKELGKTRIEVRSAGIRAANGLPPTAETVIVMKEEGIDVSEARTAYLTDDMIKKATLILVMENLHRNEIINRVPAASTKTFLLKEYARAGEKSHPEGFSVPDPIGRPLGDYRRCLELLKKEIDRIAEKL